MKWFNALLLNLTVCSAAFSQSYQFPEYIILYDDEPSIWNDSNTLCLEYSEARAKLCFEYEGKDLILVTEKDTDGDYKFMCNSEAQITKFEYNEKGDVKRVELWKNDTERMKTDNTFHPAHTANYTYDSLNRLKTMTAWGTLKEDRKVIDPNSFICNIQYDYEGSSERISQLRYVDTNGHLLNNLVSIVNFTYDNKGRIEELNFTHHGDKQLWGNCKTVKYKYKSRRPFIFGQRAVAYEVHKFYNSEGKKCSDNLHAMSFSEPSIDNFNHVLYFLAPGEWKSLQNQQHVFETHRSKHDKLGVPPAPW